MKCPLCQVEMRISKTRYKTTKEPPIRLFAVQSLICRNKQCENFGAVVDEVEHELAVNEDEEEITTEETTTVEENNTETENVAESATEEVTQEE